MKTIRLTVNGESRSAGVADRTQLAELLRDHLHLTGTHLGCEHGVCGACTVLVDGKPIRSCITYAHACEGATVVTVEGLGDDPTGRALREAFALKDRLVFMDFITDQSENVYPMMMAGKGQTDMVLRELA